MERQRIREQRRLKKVQKNDSSSSDDKKDSKNRSLETINENSQEQVSHSEIDKDRKIFAAKNVNKIGMDSD